MLLAATVSVSGCSAVMPGTSCAGFRPILPSKADVFTDGTADQINAHNLIGERLGCWKPPRA